MEGEVKVDITVLSGVSSGDVFRFSLGKERSSISIGRAPENDMVLVENNVSRKHAAIELKTNGLFLSDLGSTYGTDHMGFRVKPGPDGLRALRDGDEFKIGEAIFRIGFPEDAFNSIPEKKVKDDKDSSQLPAKAKKTLIPQKLFVPLMVVVAGVVGYLLFAPKAPKGLPPQKSHIPLDLPQERVIGYYKGGPDKDQSDTSHLDKAQFNLTASHLLIEFDYSSTTEVKLSVDQSPVDGLEPTGGIWVNYALIVRDPRMGLDRKLIFDNVEYPAPVSSKKKSSGKHKQWAVRNMRMFPMSDTQLQDFVSHLKESVSVSDGVDKTPTGLHVLLRSLQMTILASVKELGKDAALIPINTEWMYPDPFEVKQQLEAILKERQVGIYEPTLEIKERHHKVLIFLAGKLDNELWKRVRSRINRAELSSAAKNYIEAHDQLIATKGMFPDETDFRWVMADRLFFDKKIVPKKVRERPDKYRKRQYEE